MGQPSTSILVAHEEASVRDWMTSSLLNRRLSFKTLEHLDDVAAHAEKHFHRVVLLGARGDRIAHALKIAETLQSRGWAERAVILAVNGTEAFAIRALRMRLWDYISCPCEWSEIAAVLPPPDVEVPAADGIAGCSSAMREVRSSIARIARTDSTVLITGETGTGKELVAEAIHRASRRSAAPFVRINCAAIPDTLLESELFGFERGAFTGAYTRRTGLLRTANHGTVLLDEIGDMNLYAQAKLLRVIEAREMQPLGASAPVPLDIRIVAATHRNLPSLIAAERFRQDLYFRINVATIHVPPLRERTEDIPLLTGHILAILNRQRSEPICEVSSDLYQDLLDYDWPGNVRELRNILETACSYARPPRLAAADLPPHFAGGRRLRSGPANAGSTDELQRLLKALSETSWNKSKAAAKLQWSRMTLYRKLEKYRIA